MASVPEAGSLPSYDVLSSGEAVADSASVVSIRVFKALSKIPEAKIVFSDGSQSKGDFEISAKDDFKPGAELEIKAGYDRENTTIFKGIITKHGIKLSGYESSVLNVELKHKAYSTTTSRKSAVFMDKTDSDILETILNNGGQTPSVDSTSLSHKQMIQFNCSDWDFVNTRAEMNGMLVNVGDDEFKVFKPAGGESKGELKYGNNIIEADLDLDGRFSWQDFEGKTWSYTDQALSDGSPDVSGLTELGNISSDDLAGSLSQDSLLILNGAALETNEMSGITNAFKIKSVLSKIRGYVKCIGFADIQPGDFVTLSGLGERFNGSAFVSGVVHDLSPGRWETIVQVGVDQRRYIDRYEDVSDRPASGLLPAVNGLQVGLVSDIVDKDGEMRVLVKLPIASESDDAIWARVARLDAGNARGTVFHPETGDEVILGFINDDPRQAVILGMMHSSKNPVPDDLKAKDGNPIKGIVTREKMKLLFDDEKKIITIITEKGSIVIDDDQKSIIIKDDNNKNTITMDNNGIKMECQKDLQIKAQGDVKVEGNNIEFKAQANWKAEGSAGATLKSSAITEVKGSMVNIN